MLDCLSFAYKYSLLPCKSLAQSSPATLDVLILLTQRNKLIHCRFPSSAVRENERRTTSRQVERRAWYSCPPMPSNDRWDFKTSDVTSAMIRTLIVILNKDIETISTSLQRRWAMFYLGECWNCVGRRKKEMRNNTLVKQSCTQVH